MEKRPRKVTDKKTRIRKKTEVQEVIENLLANGAVEITPAMAKKEPYKHIIAKIKYDLAHEC
jgi:hypothetical protein